MKLLIPSQVESSLLSAAQYYEDCRGGLGGVFLERLEQTFQAIRENPLGFPVYEENQPGQSFRRAILRQFPFVVFYSIEPDAIVVLEVAHTSREPGYWNRKE